MGLRERALRLLGNPARTVVLQVALLWTLGYMFFIFHGLSFHLTPWSQAFINAIVKYSHGARAQRRGRGRAGARHQGQRADPRGL